MMMMIIYIIPRPAFTLVLPRYLTRPDLIPNFHPTRTTLPLLFICRSIDYRFSSSPTDIQIQPEINLARFVLQRSVIRMVLLGQWDGSLERVHRGRMLEDRLVHYYVPCQSMSSWTMVMVTVIIQIKSKTR